MKAVVLAAGMGNRLGPLTRDIPKALVQANGRELILHVMDFLDAGTFSERIVVTGCHADIFRRFLGKHRPATTVLHNPAFDKGSVMTVAVALPLIDDDFVLLNVDHIYPRRLFTAIAARHEGITAVCDFDRRLGDDDMKVKLDGNGRIVAISKQLTDYDGGYIGMTWCARTALHAYRDAAIRTRETVGEHANVEAIVGLAAREGIPINVFDASGFGWLEIDTPDDLNHATAMLRNETAFLS